MIFFRTGQYATQPCGRQLLGREIAQNLDVSSACLVRIFHDLCRDKLLHSSRGRSAVGAVVVLKIFPLVCPFDLSPSRQRFRRLSCLQQAVPPLLYSNNINKNNKLLT